MAKSAPITPAAAAATFNPAQWLSHFESVGGGYLATDSRTCLCTAHHGIALEQQRAANAMVAQLTHGQHAQVIAHIRCLAGFSNTQPDLKPVCSQGLSEPAGNTAPSSGPSLDPAEGSHQMDMTHSFVPATASAGSACWGQLFAAYEAAKVAEDAYVDAVWMPANKRQNEFEALTGINGYDAEACKKREELCAKYPNEFMSKDVRDEMERLVGVRFDLEYKLAKTPAPDMDGLRWKIAYYQDISKEHVIEPEIFEAIRSELDRLLAARSEQTASPRAEWDAAMARFKAADTACEPYVDVLAEHEESHRELCNAYRNLLDTPAPDLEALRWKLTELLDDHGEDCALADIDRLLSDETWPRTLIAPAVSLSCAHPGASKAILPDATA